MMANTNSNKLGYNGGRYYSFLNRPVLIDCNFVVDTTNGNGLGIRSLKGSGVQNVYMNSTATFTGSTHTNFVIDGIPGGTGSLTVGMSLTGTGIPAGTKIATITNSGAITTTLATTATNAGITVTYAAAGSPNPAAGLVLVQLANNYNRYAGGFSGFVSPTTGGTIAINSTSLTIGNPYIIASVGHAAAGAVTIAPVADSAGSLASTWFRLFDAYGNTFVIWFSVSGVGSAPVGTGGTLVQQSISANASAATIGAALAVTIAALPSGISGVFSFTTGGTTTVTVTSTQTNPYGPLPGVPSDGVIPTGFTFAQTVYNSNGTNWRTVGLPNGVTPAVGASFIAIATGQSTGGGSTGLVIAPGVSGITSLEVIGDPNASLGPNPLGGSPNVGGWILAQFLAATNSSTTTLIPTAPAAGSVVGMSFVVEAGSILISGE